MQAAAWTPDAPHRKRRIGDLNPGGAVKPNRISSSGPGCPDRFKLAPLTGSGCREYSYGGFGGGHAHFHVIRHCARRLDMFFARSVCTVWW
jgi:hypothetical protein